MFIDDTFVVLYSQYTYTKNILRYIWVLHIPNETSSEKEQT